MFFLCFKFYKFFFEYFKFHIKKLLLLFQTAVFNLHPPGKFPPFTLQRAALLLQSFTFFFQRHPPHASVSVHTCCQ